MIFEGNKNQVRKKEKVYRKVKKKNLRKSNLWVGESGVKYPSVLNLDQLRQSEFVDNAGKADTEQTQPKYRESKETRKKKLGKFLKNVYFIIKLVVWIICFPFDIWQDFKTLNVDLRATLGWL